LSIVFFKYCEYKDTTVLWNLDMNYCFSLLQRNECHVKNDLFLKEKCCQQSVNILSIADNDGTICHNLFIGTDIALKSVKFRSRTKATKGTGGRWKNFKRYKELIDN